MLIQTHIPISMKKLARKVPNPTLYVNYNLALLMIIARDSNYPISVERCAIHALGL
jgi:hypothetical protein